MTDVGIMVGNVALNSDSVRQLMDSPSNNYLSDDTCIRIIKRCYRWVNSETDISGHSDDSVVDAIYALAVWQCYMVYVESVSEFFQNQTPRMIMTRLEEFQGVAILYLKSIGIIWPLDDKGNLRGMDIEKIKINYGYSDAVGVLTLNDVYNS